MDFWRRLHLLLVFVLLLLVLGCTQGDGSPDEDVIPGVTYVVQRGQVVREIEFPGQIVPVEEVQLYFQIPGYVEQVHVLQGQRVNAGDVLAELGGEYLRNQISAAELNLALVEAQLGQAVSENEHLIAQAEIALILAREELTRTVLVESHVAQAGVDRAEIELEHLKKGVSPVLEVEVDQAKLALDRLRESSRIVAQIDGTVASVLILPGQLVDALEPAFVVANSDDVEVRAYPSQDQMRDMFEQQSVIVSLLNGDEQTWLGQIRHLNSPYTSLYNLDGPAVIDSSTRIGLDGPTDEFKIGDPVSVKVVLDQKDRILWLPSDAIRTFQGSAFVIARVEGGQRRVDIETGISGQDRVEIVSGLVMGQVVIAP